MIEGCGVPFSSITTCAGLAVAISLGCGDNAATPDAAEGDAAVEAQAFDADDSAKASDAAVVPRGARVLGISVVLGDLDFQKNVRTAHDAGASATNVSLAWDKESSVRSAQALQTTAVMAPTPRRPRRCSIPCSMSQTSCSPKSALL